MSALVFQLLGSGGRLSRRCVALWCVATVVLVAGLGMAPLSEAVDPMDTGPVGVAEIKAACDRGANWLIDHQRDDGAYGGYASDVGITALVVQALAVCPRRYAEDDGPYVSAAVEYLLQNVQEEGGIFNEGQGLENYKTSVSILALTALDHGRKSPRYASTVARARDFVLSLQLSEDSKPPFDPEKHVSAGGFGYGSSRRPDMSNTQFALEALQAAGLAEDSDVWQRATVFLNRCQNHSSNDVFKKDEYSSTGDGGFYYAPKESKAGRIENPDGSVGFSSYGSITYAGLKSYIYAGLKKDDPRVLAAWKWIQANYTVDENPNMATEKDPSRGQMGLYYYYLTMARTFEVVEVKEVTTPDGVKHAWAQELAAKLLSLQRPDGSWVNTVDRWWEGDPTVTTAYALRALTICHDVLK